MYWDVLTKSYWQRRYDKSLFFEDGYELTHSFVRSRLGGVYQCTGDGYYTYSSLYLDEGLTIEMGKSIVIAEDFDIFYYCVG